MFETHAFPALLDTIANGPMFSQTCRNLAQSLVTTQPERYFGKLFIKKGNFLNFIMASNGISDKPSVIKFAKITDKAVIPEKGSAHAAGFDLRR